MRKRLIQIDAADYATMVALRNDLLTLLDDVDSAGTKLLYDDFRLGRVWNRALLLRARLNEVIFIEADSPSLKQFLLSLGNLFFWGVTFALVMLGIIAFETWK